mgnify:CR=1 FL=1
MPNALVIIPTYNEIDNLASIIERVRASSAIDVLVVDDGSPDGTGALADAIAEKAAEVRAAADAEIAAMEAASK